MEIGMRRKNLFLKKVRVDLRHDKLINRNLQLQLSKSSLYVSAGLALKTSIENQAFERSQTEKKA